HRYVRQWKESEGRHGHLTLDDIVTMAELDPRQLVQVAPVWPQVGIILDLQGPLRWYARAQPDLQRQMARAPGVPISRLAGAVEDVRQERDPSQWSEPVYMRVLEHTPADRVFLMIQEGNQELSDGKPIPCVNVTFEEYHFGGAKWSTLPVPI